MPAGERGHSKTEKGKKRVSGWAEKKKSGLVTGSNNKGQYIIYVKGQQPTVKQLIEGYA